MSYKVTPHRPYHWRERFLQMLLVPLTAEVMRFVTAWGDAEDGAARNNPLNTTYRMPGATTLDGNPDGVLNYVTPVEGICATASTIARGDVYRELWKDLQSGRYTAEQIVDRNEGALRTWGTNLDVLRRRISELS